LADFTGIYSKILFAVNHKRNTISAMNVDDLMAHYRARTQMDLARKVGISQPLISRWVRDGIPWRWQCRLQVESRGRLKATKLTEE